MFWCFSLIWDATDIHCYSETLGLLTVVMRLWVDLPTKVDSCLLCRNYTFFQPQINLPEISVNLFSFEFPFIIITWWLEAGGYCPVPLTQIFKNIILSSSQHLLGWELLLVFNVCSFHLSVNILRTVWMCLGLQDKIFMLNISNIAIIPAVLSGQWMCLGWPSPLHSMLCHLTKQPPSSEVVNLFLTFTSV